MSTSPATRRRKTTRPHGTVRYRHGPDENGTPGRPCRCAACRDAKRVYEAHRTRMIAYGRWEGYADATGTRRRVQALMRNGWPLAKLAARLGVSREFETVARGETGQVYPATAEAVRALYDELWDQSPPREARYDRMGSTRARNRAIALGYQPVGAWDDSPGPHFIDDPAAVPVPGCVRQDKRQYGSLTEEAAELAGHGEHPEMIAVRLGTSVKSVERTLTRIREAA